MQSTLFTTLTANEEANLCGGGKKVIIKDNKVIVVKDNVVKSGNVKIIKSYVGDIDNSANLFVEA